MMLPQNIRTNQGFFPDRFFVLKNIATYDLHMYNANTKKERYKGK